MDIRAFALDGDDQLPGVWYDRHGIAADFFFSSEPTLRELANSVAS